MTRVLFFLTFLTLGGLLQANPSDQLLETFLQKGSKSLVKELETFAQDTKTWQRYLKGKSLKYGFFNRMDHLILANKQAKSVEVYDVRNHQVKLYKHFSAEVNSPVLFGSVVGDKQVEGDKKTPVGLYEFTRVKDKAALNEEFGVKEADKYGPLAFVTTYPNLMDKMVYQKTGYGIWLHGKPTDPSKKFDTRGCIAIDNDELARLGKFIDFRRTTMVIAQGEPVTTNKNEIALVLANLYRWKNAWQKGDRETYLSFYKEFEYFVGLRSKRRKKPFLAHKGSVFERTTMASIDFKQVNIVPYRESSGRKLFKISFAQDYTSNLLPNGVRGFKNLYVWIKDKHMQILIEESAKLN